MCCILGYNGKHEEKTLKKLLLSCRLRGVHAFGVAYYEKGKLNCYKSLNYTDFENYILQNKLTRFIAHYRYSTSGDYKNMKNNQPLIWNNDCLAFNGVINQGTKKEIEAQYDLKLPSDNDGYVLMKKLNDTEFLKSNITFAAITINKDVIKGIRNIKRPLYKYSDKNKSIFCSTKDILFRSGLTQNIERLKANTFYEI